jgi:hypothetical protein
MFDEPIVPFLVFDRIPGQNNMLASRTEYGEQRLYIIGFDRIDHCLEGFFRRGKGLLRIFRINAAARENNGKNGRCEEECFAPERALSPGTSGL